MPSTERRGELRPTSKGFSARIRLGDDRATYALPFTDRALAAERCNALADFAERLERAGHIDVAPKLLEVAAKARVGRPWEAAVAAIEAMCREALSASTEASKWLLPCEPRPSSVRGYVYLIVAEPLVKIGWSRDPMRRLSEIVRHESVNAWLAGLRPAGPQEERTEHMRWGKFHERTEWFRLSGELRAMVSALISRRSSLREVVA